MPTAAFLAKARQHLTVTTSLFALLANLGGPLSASAQSAPAATPIKHVIVIIGENRTFDQIGGRTRIFCRAQVSPTGSP